MAALLVTTFTRRLVKHHRGFIATKCFSSSEAVTPPEQKQNVQVSDVAAESYGKKFSYKQFSQLAESRFVYPEFLPVPQYEFRHKLREKLERADMLKRRMEIDIPEFYVGSILAVTAADPFAPGKQNRFVGICISRTYVGLRATFVLRNIVDKQGIEIMYDMYNPTIHKIEVLKLEKRLDSELLYLRDALPEYSTFPFDMEPEFIVEGEPVPVNPLKVKLKPPPWFVKWERRDLKGILSLEGCREERLERARKLNTPWQKYDIMTQYRKCIVEEDQQEIWEEVETHKKLFQLNKKQWKQQILQKAPRKTKR